jgi:hypothetical protein
MVPKVVVTSLCTLMAHSWRISLCLIHVTATVPCDHLLFWPGKPFRSHLLQVRLSLGIRVFESSLELGTTTVED